MPRIEFLISILVSIDELEKLFTKFSSVSYAYSVNFIQFEKLFEEYVPWWTFGVAEVFKVQN